MESDKSKDTRPSRRARKRADQRGSGVEDSNHPYGLQEPRDLMKSAPPMQVDDHAPYAVSSAEAVNLEYVFGSITSGVPAESNPDDIPNLLFSNEFILQFTLIANSSGAAVMSIKPENLTYAGATANQLYLNYNIDNLFNPLTGTGGTWIALASPLAAAGATLFTRVKSLGVEIEILPITSAVESKGNYTTVFTTTSPGTTSYPGTFVLPISVLTRIPYAQTYDMRSRAASRTFEESIYQDIGTGANNPENYFILMMQGCEPGAAITLRITQKYQAHVADGGQSIVRGKVPRLGPYTRNFKDFLRLHFNDITSWPTAEVYRLYRDLKQVPSVYSRLVDFCLRAR